jgi:hypothetical protein
MLRYGWFGLFVFGMPSHAELALDDFLSCRGWNQSGSFAQQRPRVEVLSSALQAMRESHSKESQQVYLRPIQPLYIYDHAPIHRVVLATQTQPRVSTILLEIDLPAAQLKAQIEHELRLSLPYHLPEGLYQTTQTFTTLTNRHVRVLTIKPQGERSILYCGERLDPLIQPVTQLSIHNNQLVLH